MDTLYNVFCGRVIEDNQTTIMAAIKRLVRKPEKKYCTFQSLCRECKFKRSVMCKNYHLYKHKYRLVTALKYYFPNFASDYTLLDIMYNLGVGTVERGMRTYYEQMYVSNPDTGHRYFTDVILPRSYTYDHDPALRNNSYWKVILYVSIVDAYSHQFPIIARNGLNGILDTEKYTAKTVVHDPPQPLQRSQINFDTLLLNFFNEYVQHRVFDETIVNKYNIDVYSNVYKLILINSCMLMLKLYKLPLEYLFDRDVIYVMDANDYYKLNCNHDELFISVYVKKPQRKQRTMSYDYLNLMSNINNNNNTNDEINDCISDDEECW